jgi:general secretion pathway protein K
MNPKLLKDSAKAGKKIFFAPDNKSPISAKNILKNEKGVALLITLSIITILFIVSLEVNRRVRQNSEITNTLSTEAQLMEIAQSGISVAKAILLKDAIESSTDSVQEDWANPEKLREILQSLGFDADTLNISISDEMGKIQVNALLRFFPGNDINLDQKKIWENLLSFLISKDKSKDVRDTGTIINCLTDWLDSGDNEAVSGFSGAENDYYQSLDPPYSCANGELYDLSEIFFVKGISHGLFKQAESLRDFFPYQEDKGQTIFEPDDLLTVFGLESDNSNNINRNKKKYSYSGRININTAPVPVIAAILPFGKQDIALKIAEFRTAKDSEDGDFSNNLNETGWYAGIADLNQEETKQFDSIITYSSHIFSVKSRASINGQTFVLKNVILRQKNKNGQWQCINLRQFFI